MRLYTAGPPGVRGNGTRSAIAAGYAVSGAGQEAERLLKDVHVQAVIQRRLARNDVTADRVLAELGAVAMADPRDFLSWGPDGVTLKPSDELAHAAPIASVGEYTSKDGSKDVRVRFHDKIAALGHLAKITGLIREQSAGANVTINVMTGVPGDALRPGVQRALSDTSADTTAIQVRVDEDK